MQRLLYSTFVNCAQISYSIAFKGSKSNVRDRIFGRGGLSPYSTQFILISYSGSTSRPAEPVIGAHICTSASCSFKSNPLSSMSLRRSAAESSTRFSGAHSMETVTRHRSASPVPLTRSRLR